MPRLRSAPVPARIPWGEFCLAGSFALPADHALGLVVLLHAPADAAAAARDDDTAGALLEAGFATLTCDLLAPHEHDGPRPPPPLAGEIELLASRVESAAAWARSRPGCRHLALGYFGVGAGAAAALVAAAEDGPEVRAVVAHGGRPDHAGEALGFVHAPTLLIVGSADEEALAANQAAFGQLGGKKSLEIVLGAGAECAEVAAHELVGESAAAWFRCHLAPEAT